MTHPNAIQPGDLIEVHIGDDTFEATVKAKHPKAVSIEPVNPITYLYRYCHYAEIVRVVSRPEGGEEAS